MTIYADLHNHTTASDGDLTPDELVFNAKELGINTIGITDHDTLDSLGNAIAAGKNYGVGVIPGVEASVRFDKPFFKGTLHLLCYFPEKFLNNIEFVNSFTRVLSRGRGNTLVKARVDRINTIFGPNGETPILAKELLFEDIERYSSNATRRHFTLALKEIHGIKKTGQVNRIIGNKSPAYIPSGVALKEIGELLDDFPLFTVLAHPAAGSFEGRGHYKEVLPPFEVVEKLLPDFLDLGLKGIEVYYPGHGEKFLDILLSLAREYDLIVTGGSDCHDGRLRPLGLNGIDRPGFEKFKAGVDACHIPELPVLPGFTQVQSDSPVAEGDNTHL